MNRTGTVKKGHNCLAVSLSGDQSFVKIFDAGGELIRHSQTKGATEIRHMVDPGRYRVETDGKITQLRSMQIELEAEEALAQIANLMNSDDQNR